MPLPLLLALALMPTPDRTVQTTDLAPGAGEPVRLGDVVEVNYVGRLAGPKEGGLGKEFDRSKGKPFRFQVGLGAVIAGWDQGLVGMRTGGKRRLQIPSDLGYGAQGAGPDIPPGADLDFEVELVRIAPRAKVVVLKTGTGAGAGPTDAVSFHYTGTLEKGGKKFDSSYDRKAPLQVELRRLVPGFIQGVIGMKPGERRRVTIPAELAYGAAGIPARDSVDEGGKVIPAGSLIPANSNLVFEIEFIEILKPKG